MKYIDSEKLIAEIERRIEETKPMKPSFDQFWAGQISAFKGAIKIITSLQQEQPEVELGREIDNWLDAEPHTVRDTAIHFYELGLNARK